MKEVNYFMDRIDRIQRAIQEFLKNKKFKNLEEANAGLIEFIWKLNNTPVDEFCGLTPYHMDALIYQPFNSPDVVRFNLEASPPLEAPFIRLLLMLLEEIGKEPEGLKATAKGNLPRKICRKIEEEFFPEEIRKLLLRDRHPIMKEENFWDLHVVRVVAELSGFLKKYKKSFVLTKKGKSIVERGFTIRDYMHLFQTFTREFNWAYSDYYEEIPIMQDSFLFTLYLLHLYGDEYRPREFYSALFIRAYPHVLEEVPSHIMEPEDLVKNIYKIRVLENFAVVLGFAESKEKFHHLKLFNQPIKKTVFLDEFINFQVEK